MEHTQHIDFHLVTVADKPLFDAYIGCSDVLNCDLNFANIFCWSDTYHSEVGEAEGFLFIRFDYGGSKAYMQPVGGGDKRVALALLLRDAAAQQISLRLYGLSQEWRDFLEENYPTEFAFDAPRALYDYIYRSEDLAQLRGRKYQPKRNHINRFVERNDWRVEPLSRDNIRECKRLNDKWLKGREVDEMERAEQMAMGRAFENMEALGLRGEVLYANGQVVAFSYGTPITNRTFCTHVEKYDSECEGAATMINRLMAQSLEEEFELINREDDLGLEGLRFAKLSYSPTILLEKVSALHLTEEQRDMREMWHNIFGDDYAEIDSFLIRHSDAVPMTHKESGRVVSMLFVVPLSAWGKRVAYIYAVATQPEYRGRGFATQLLNEALKMVEASGEFDLAALIPSSFDAKRLYAKLGFEEAGRLLEFPDGDYLGSGSVVQDMAMTLQIKTTKA